jgi:phosphoribosylanthranilate isomerase
MAHSGTPRQTQEPPRPAGPLLKICGLRQVDQAAAIAALEVDAIGVIGVAASPRFVAPARRPSLFAAVREVSPACRRVLVVADPDDADLELLDPRHGHTLLQLHGGESPERCRELRRCCGCPVWKALRLRTPADLDQVEAYADAADALLLDAWVPEQLGGTGQRIPLAWLAGIAMPLPWWLAGGINAGRVPAVLDCLSPDGLDASSSVERAPGDKDLALVRRLVSTVRDCAGARSCETGEDHPSRD